MRAFGRTGLRRRKKHHARREIATKKHFTVSDGKLVLMLESDESGGYVVSSPYDPALLTQAETIEEAFANAYDAAEALKQWRAKLFRKLALAATR
jgi:hypothetical protein